MSGSLIKNNNLGTGGRLMPGITHHQNCSHFNNTLINNCQHPTIQTLGDRRFYLFPSDRAPISLIEAPPTYQDALKHPKFTAPPARNSRHLVHPTTDRPEISDFQNLNFRLSPNELQMEFEEIERENERIRWLQMNENGIEEEEEEGIERNVEREEQEDENKEEELPQTINLDEFEEINLNDDNEDGKSKKEEKCEEDCCYISGPSTSKNDERNENSKKEENNDHNISTNLSKIFKKEIINSKEKGEENKRSNTVIRPSSARSNKILSRENNYRMQNSF